jgi:small GTP-binding protein
MAIPPKHKRLKLLLIGNSGVGKSFMLSQFCKKDPWYAAPTMGVDFSTHMYAHPNVPSACIKLHIWDTGGQDKYRFLTRSYYTNSQGIMLVYDVGNRDSFADIRYWLDESLSHQKGVARHMLVGIVKGVGRAVTKEEGEKFAQTHNVPFMEVSTPTDVDTAFNMLITDCLKDEVDGFSGGESTPILLTQYQRTRPQEFFGCCV